MIFVDSSFWVALNLERDPHRSDAVELLSAHRHEALVTTNHVVGETWTFLGRRSDHPRALAFVDSVRRTSRLRLVHVQPELEVEAFDWLRTHDEREYSFVDATSFAVMRSMRIAEAFAFDGDFSAAGFIELRP